MFKSDSSIVANKGVKVDTVQPVLPHQRDPKQMLNTNAQSTKEDDDDDDENEFWDDAKEEQANDNNDSQHLLSNSNFTSQSSSCAVKDSAKTYQTHNSKASTSINNKPTSLAVQVAADAEGLRLHEAVYNNDADKIYNILKNEETVKGIINRKDKHGNTPLHLACMLGRSKMIVSALLQCGAAIDTKNLNRWTPFHEACSYGNREIVTLMTKQLKDDVYDAINKNKLSENLEKTKNYRLVLKWEFQSWVPFLTRVLPSDVCVINKQGKYIRIDTRLLDYEMLSWKKGDSCLIYSDKFEKKWIIMNNKSKKFQHFGTKNISKDIEDKVDEFMSQDIMDFELKSTDMQLTRSTSGWIWKADKIEKVGKYNAHLYNFNNVVLVTRKRREHLSEEDLKRNKAAYTSALHVLKFGPKQKNKELEESSSQSCEGEEDSSDNRSESHGGQEESEVQHRESLSPPPATNITWAQYCRAEPGNYEALGREHKCKIVKTAFKANVAMSDEFPISKNEFLDLLSIVPLKMFKKLKEFIEMRLPEGFPIRLDIPVLPFLTARITFEDFAFVDGPIDESLFSIPPDYEEDANLLPLLS